MKNTYIIVFWLAVCLSSLISGCDRQPGETESKAQRRSAPDFTLNTLDNGVFSSDKLHGMVSLLVFFDPTCSDCIHSLVDLKKFYLTNTNKFHEVNVVAIASIATELEQIDAVLKGMDFPFRISIDHGEKLKRKFGVTAFKSVGYLVDKEGYIAKEYVGHIDFNTLAKDITAVSS